MKKIFQIVFLFLSLFFLFQGLGMVSIFDVAVLVKYFDFSNNIRDILKSLLIIFAVLYLLNILYSLLVFRGSQAKTQLGKIAQRHSVSLKIHFLNIWFALAVFCLLNAIFFQNRPYNFVLLNNLYISVFFFQEFVRGVIKQKAT